MIDIEGTEFADRSAKKGVLALDPNTNSLHVFRIEPYGDSHFISRVGALEVSLAEFMPVNDRSAVLSNLSADRNAREVHVASNSVNVVLRFEFDGKTLRSRGRFAMNAPVRALKMSPEGDSAAIVTGSEPFGGDWRIVLITEPASLADWLQIPDSFPSIRTLQQVLNENGYAAGMADGILGPQTTSAVADYRAQLSDYSENAKSIPELDSAIISSFPVYLLKERQR